ncbi:MAG: thiamine pyrophosphate-binding protein [Pedobacter sp.]|nr:MAG: thiamine pyrophosphate-binding protein [Pedobacter sp.]
MKVSDFIANFLVKKGIKSIFELSGGMITHILDSVNQTTDINIVTMHHEQGAAFAAEGFARTIGMPGVALATSGPGATNLLTGIGSCYFDSTPAIFITGQVNRHELKGDRDIRQLGFQETDIITMAKPITKATYFVNDPNDIPRIFEEAYHVSLQGRPGPVLIDIPMDVQRAQIDPGIPAITNDLINQIDSNILEQLIFDIKAAKRPLILAGRGIRAGNCHNKFIDFLGKTQIPVITSLLGFDAVTYNNPLRVGFIGSYGNRWANIAFGKCDLLIVLGSRLDIRQTGADVDFIASRKIYHIDIEKAEINNRVKGCKPIVADLTTFFDFFAKAAKTADFILPVDWLAHIAEIKKNWPDTNELNPTGINPNIFMHHLSAQNSAVGAYTVDVGSHQMWAAQSLEISEEQLFLTSGGMGAMGFALPAAIGACIALNKKPVVVIAGDGCIQINIQELQTIVRNNLPIKIVVLNNRALGMIRQFQDSYFESRYQSTYWGYSAPDFEKIALAYGIAARTIDDPKDITAAVKWLKDTTSLNQPQLLQVMIDPHTNTYPKIAFGKPITEMEPFAKPLDMEGT